jgi:hypothetical protein
VEATILTIDSNEATTNVMTGIGLVIFQYLFILTLLVILKITYKRIALMYLKEVGKSSAIIKKGQHVLTFFYG